MTLTSSRNKKNTPENYGPWCLSKSPLVKETHLQTTNFSGGLTHVNIPGCIRHNKTLTDWNGQEATWLIFAGIRLCKASLPLGSNRDHNLQSVEVGDFFTDGDPMGWESPSFTTTWENTTWEHRGHMQPAAKQLQTETPWCSIHQTYPPVICQWTWWHKHVNDWSRFPLERVMKQHHSVASTASRPPNTCVCVCVSRSPWVDLFGEIPFFHASEI